MSTYPLLAHVNLSRGFRGGERQTELLVRGLSAMGVSQRLIVRAGEPLAERLAGLADVEVIEARGFSGGLLATYRLLHGVDLIHSHEGRGLHACALYHLRRGVPYVATRRVLVAASRGRWTHGVYLRAASVAAISTALEKVLQEYDP